MQIVVLSDLLIAKVYIGFEDFPSLKEHYIFRILVVLLKNFDD